MLKEITAASVCEMDIEELIDNYAWEFAGLDRCVSSTETKECLKNAELLREEIKKRIQLARA